LHASWLVAWLSISITGGIAFAAIAKTAWAAAVPVLATSVILMAVAFLVRTRWTVLLIIVTGLSIGFWRGGIEQTGLQRYNLFYGRSVIVQGVVSDDISTGPGGDERLTLKDLAINGVRLNGYLWISTDSTVRIQRSDRVTLKGKLGLGFGSIAASMFHATITHVARAQPGDIGLHVRDWFAGGIRAAIPEPEASLASGYLIGQRSALPQDVDEQLKTVSLTHAVVASGYNLTILVSLARQLMVGVSKYLAAFSAVTMMGSFILISGASPSMTRAGLVTSLTLAAWCYGRKIHPIVLLPFVAAITALFNPFYVWGDIGWYLSFTSFAGVIILAPLVQHALWRNKEKPGLVMQTVIDTMSAQLATLPIMLLAFGHYSPYALLANLLVLPLVPLTMLLSFIAGVIGLSLPAAAHFVGLPADFILRYMLWAVSHIAELPGAQGELTITVPAAFACYVLLGFGVCVLGQRLHFSFRSEPEINSA